MATVANELITAALPQGGDAPDSPSRPSDYDREHAWPWFSYVIISVTGGRAVDAHAWQLRDDRSGFDAVVLTAAAAAMKGENK